MEDTKFVQDLERDPDVAATIDYVAASGVVETHQIDWNRWHTVVEDSLDAFDVDIMCNVCDKLGLYFRENDDIVPLEIYREIRNMIRYILDFMVLKENPECEADYKNYSNYGVTVAVGFDGEHYWAKECMKIDQNVVSGIEPGIFIELKHLGTDNEFFCIDFQLVPQIF